MDFLSSDDYKSQIKTVATLVYNWDKLSNSRVLITGATGMIGSFMIDVLMYRNEHRDMNCQIIALGRSEERGHNRFSDYWNSSLFDFVVQDINDPIVIDNTSSVDYIFHGASNTHPEAYATDPVGTVLTNIIGTKNLMEYGVHKNLKRFIFASSVEIYGENRGDTEYFDESYLGYIDCNTLRAGYPEGKRASESLCQAYRRQYGVEVVIPRLARTYGPTMLKSDTKAISQFIKNGLNNEDIVLKSEGNQNYSYTHVADAVSGVFCVWLDGIDGEAYNIADKESDITLKDLAELIARESQTKVIFDLPSETEKAGFSKATKALLNGEKIKTLGWKPIYKINEGIQSTLKLLKN